MKKRIQILFLLILFPLGIRAQSNITTQNLIWYGYYFQLRLNEKWYLVSEIHERHFVAPFAQRQFLARTHAHRTLGKGFEAGIGLTGSLQNPNNPRAILIITVPEIRPNIELGYEHKIQNLIFDHRFVAEARYFHNVEKDLSALSEGYFFQSFRWRYRFQFSFPLIKIGENGNLRLKVNDEIMLKSNTILKNQILDQNRVYLGLNFETKSSFSFEIGYLNSHLKRLTGDFYNRNIIRINILQKIGIGKKSQI